ncbi:ABC transporter ATP-binding protein [Thalassobaculum salexigens]|uniref:ABC transporter ATP-binding protein n=1 Tax=Thalassobaculum salexigens TaxID=455360 RepID=UPI0004018D93|nr:ABC transporter ATP-binding protein [Thalassobaculum salexigens]
MSTLLEIRDLTVRIDLPGGPVFPVRDVSLRIGPGETLGLVGESGCGKTLTCLSVMGLFGRRVSVESGEIAFKGTPLDPKSRADRARRARGMGMIFQNPMTGLNPVRTLGWQVAEAYRIRTGSSRRAAAARAVELLDLVGIPEPRRRSRDYPHQISGGQQQRAMIAMAIAGEPALLVADEPTTALDVTVQAQIVELLSRLQRDLGMGMLFVTHDLGLVAEVADRVAVMYAGRVVEMAPAAELFARPRHPYTQGLLTSLPFLDDEVERLSPIDGTVPSLRAMPRGCAFAPRCPHASEICRTAVPDLSGAVACHHPLAVRTEAA